MTKPKVKEPGAGDDAGVEGNARLTSSTGTLLLVMLAVEGFTVLGVRQLITLHVFLGVMLLGPVLLKTGSTLYRFARYYRGAPAYVRKGPPHPVLRLLGPLVILLSLVLLGTGVGLLAVSPEQAGLLRTVHKLSFFAWFAAMTVHVVGHVREAAVGTWHEVRPVAGDPASRRRGLRTAAVGLALLAGVGTATALLPTATPWLQNGQHGNGGR